LDTLSYARIKANSEINKMTKEKLKEQLLAEISRRNIDFVVDSVESNPKLINYLLELYVDNDRQVSMRAAWGIEKLAERKNVDLTPFIPGIINNLPKLKHSGTRRCIVKVLMLHDIPLEQEGEMMDFCFQMLESPKEPVAVKANCMTSVFKLLPKYPEIKNELFAIIEDQIPNNSVGFKSRFNVLKRKYRIQ
jgi:HEAT repeat protein